MQGWGFVYLPSLLYHLHLAYFFGMPFLPLFTFLKDCYFLWNLFGFVYPLCGFSYPIEASCAVNWHLSHWLLWFLSTWGVVTIKKHGRNDTTIFLHHFYILSNLANYGMWCWLHDIYYFNAIFMCAHFALCVQWLIVALLIFQRFLILLKKSVAINCSGCGRCTF